MSGDENTINPLEMSDADIEKLNGPPVQEESTDEENENVEDTSKVEKESIEEDSIEEEDKEIENKEVKESSKENTTSDGQEFNQTNTENKDEKITEEVKDTLPDYKALYEELMGPLKANGKTIEFKSPEELRQIAQMGANYTRKMQAIAPYRKILLMLENNGLLDEGKLTYLIDLDKKNPEAVKKLVKDTGLDPRDIDVDDPQAIKYLEGNHRVTDEEANFRTILDELSSNPDGKSTLQEIQAQWDQASKEVLWKEPDVMTLIHEQRQNGIYERIATEVERQRALGAIPTNVPFLHAYKAIGDQLASTGGFDDLVKAVTPSQPQQPVVTRVQQPKPVVANADKVSAASPTRSTPRKAETFVNPLALSDDEFEKEFAAMQGRL